MATPMTESKKLKLESRKESRRCVVWVPVQLGFLLDLVSRYTGKTKNDLYQEIWDAGVAAHLGLDKVTAPEVIPQPLPRGAEAPKELQALINALVGDA